MKLAPSPNWWPPRTRLMSSTNWSAFVGTSLGLAPVGPSVKPPETVNAVKPGNGVAMFLTPRLAASKYGT